MEVEFLETLQGAIYILCVYGAMFFMLSLFIEPHDPNGKNFQHLKKVHKKRKIFEKEFRLEAGYHFVNTLITDFIIKFLLVYLTLYVLEKFIPFQIFASTIETLPLTIQIVLGLIIADAAFFFPHWFQHKFMWPVHSIHHSAKELHWITALRLHPLDHISFAIGGAIAMHIFGFSGQAILYAIIIHNTYNVFVHANMSLDFPKPLCYILGSPNYHRWHHATDKEAIDKNLATMFPIFDLIFKTYYYPLGQLPKAYGLSNDKENTAFPQSLGGQLTYPIKKLFKKRL